MSKEKPSSQTNGKGKTGEVQSWRDCEPISPVRVKLAPRTSSSDFPRSYSEAVKSGSQGYMFRDEL